jgi:hypothetical protein
VSHIASHLSEECIDYIKIGKHSPNGPQKQFGENIKFTPQQSRPLYPCTSCLVDFGMDRGTEILKDFSMKYDDIAALITTKEDVKKNHIKKNEVGKYYYICFFGFCLVYENTLCKLRTHCLTWIYVQLHDNVCPLLKLRS